MSNYSSYLAAPDAEKIRGYGYASWHKRAAAYVIDMQISLVVLLTLIVIAEGVRHYIGPGHNTLLTVLVLVIWFAVSFLNRCITMGRTGQSWGRRAVGLYLVRESDAKPTGITKAVVREFGHAADILLAFSGYIRPLYDRKRQTYADKMLRTVTVDKNTLGPDAA